jgi:hypothetical protein
MSGVKISELPEPGAVRGAQERADEILRVWIVDRQELATTFPPMLYGDDIWKWGRLLANIARYAAEAHAKETGTSREEALAAIAVNFDEEVRRNGGGGAIVATRER